MPSLSFLNRDSPVYSPFSQVKLTFEGNTPVGRAPLEFVIPLPVCAVCQHPSAQTKKRPFIFTSRPFPFDLGDYPHTLDTWTKLASDVYQWLTETVTENHTDEWRWAVNFFWICYLGSAPHFPAVANNAIDWDPDVVSISGEFMNSRSLLMALGQYVGVEKGAQLIARLVEWMQQREKWIVQGVDNDEFQRRIVAHEI